MANEPKVQTPVKKLLTWTSRTTGGATGSRYYSWSHTAGVSTSPQSFPLLLDLCLSFLGNKPPSLNSYGQRVRDCRNPCLSFVCPWSTELSTLPIPLTPLIVRPS